MDGASSSTQTHFTSADDIFNGEKDGVEGEKSHKVSCREYYCYKLQVRKRERSVLLYSRRLLHQFIVDMYIKVESTRLDFFRTQQTRIRAELYQGIVDSVVDGEVDARKVGKHIVLPASFIGGPRDMRRRYIDAIALVSKFGKPDLFITMTCNPDWAEIKKMLLEGQTAQDRPDIAVRVFRGKLHDLKQQLFTNKHFGDVATHVYVIEFQKCGLPHAYLLIILSKEFKITNASNFDRFVCVEIPDPDKYPDLHAKVVKHMMHGPCGDNNPKNVCMTDEGCKNRYPRAFSAETIQGVRAVKYLYKYIYKGHDKVAIHIDHGGQHISVDEIKQYQDARWVAGPEAIWQLFAFYLNEIYPPVINLQLHLPNQQSVTYWETQNLRSVLNSNIAALTMLTEFFTYCRNDPLQEPHLYGNFPEKFVWHQNTRSWAPRIGKIAIGRINTAPPSEGERYFLRLLLAHVRSPTSFADLLTVDGIRCQTFKDAAEKRGLLETNDWIFQCIEDAKKFEMSSALRRLFATLLVFCQPTNVRGLWDHYYNDLSEDYGK